MEYPLNCYSGVCREENNELLELGEEDKWEEVVSMIEGKGYLVNKSRNIQGPEKKENEEKQVFNCKSLKYLGAKSILHHGLVTTYLPQSLVTYVDSHHPSLWTLLHHAAASTAAGTRVLQCILQAGAYRSLKTRNGETAYDIALARGRGQEVLEILKLPEAVTENRETIEKMEAALHGVIRGRVEFLIEKHGLQLPQISIMWEADNIDEAQVWYPVPGMYGGFKLSFECGNLVSLSWVRVCGGSEMRHVIHPDGTVVDESEKVAGTFT